MDARDLALEVLRRVSTQGAFASLALSAELDRRGLDERDRGLATELVYGVLRRRAELDKAISIAADKRLKDLDPKLHDPLRIAAYQLLFLDRVPDHAATNAAVEQVKRRGGQRSADRANAILRKIGSQPREARLPKVPDATQDPAGHLALAGNVARPLAELFIQELGFERARSIVLAMADRAPLVLRRNRRVIGRDALAAEVGGQPGEHPDAVVLPEKLGLQPQALAAVLEGRASVQDEASMRVVDLLEPAPGEKILDLCAAPGGKTTAIAERMDDRGEVVACDRHKEKLGQIDEQAKRLGLRSVHTEDPAPALAPAFDRVLVDAPCSGLGTLRRHPEIRWRFQPTELEPLVRAQKKLLAEAAARVKPGGVLVYSVCSVLPSEAEGVVAELPGFTLEATLRTDPTGKGSPDGFFAARLRRA